MNETQSRQFIGSVRRIYWKRYYPTWLKAKSRQYRNDEELERWWSIYSVFFTTAIEWAEPPTLLPRWAESLHSHWLTCKHLEDAGLWDTRHCCPDCHADPNLMLPFVIEGSVVVITCCKYMEYDVLQEQML
jgi:hypothetical protein